MLESVAGEVETLYKLTVATGDTLFSGTMNFVYATIIGSAGQSNRQLLDHFGLDLCPGAIDIYSIPSKLDIGDIRMVRLEKEAFLVNDSWFCRYVEVAAPGGRVHRFPANHWLEQGSMELREGLGILPQHETLAQLKEKRAEELSARRHSLRWLEWQAGLPLGVDSKSFLDLPCDTRFDDEKSADFNLSFLQSVQDLGLRVFMNLDGMSWTKIEDFRRLFTRVKSEIAEYISHHWDQDWFFGYQFMNGVNPVLIKRCTKLPENFPVTTNMVKSSLVRECSLEDEIKHGNVYIVDYQCLDGIPGNTFNHSKPFYLAAPMCLLYVNKQGQLLPIAIQLQQKPSADNPIFLPSDSAHDWMLAKMWVRSMDFQIHEISTHLLKTHLLAEVFTMATLRQLSTMHPVHKLLYRHLRFTLEINVRARTQLVGTGAFVDQALSIGGGGHFKLGGKGLKALTYRHLCILKDVADRGVGDLPSYYYRDDACSIWKTIHKFVDKILAIFYKRDEDVRGDAELQVFVDDINHALLSNPSNGFPTKFTCVAELSEFLTMVVFLCSAQHSAVNYGQFDFYAWIPNAPSAMRKPPPTTKGVVDMPFILQTLPDVQVSCISMAITWVLSRSAAEKTLGTFPDEPFQNPDALKAMQEYQSDLEVITKSIVERNKTLPIKYPYLKPDKVANSITI
ncbi:polyunsaturated fatty acid 5-lipoxygenase-like [Petromyzon marinus]|uniref:polyunsaturated fatty acid 5-lipoxygenase-like n=1 Tax=Petromyzon marinus TaxID=7757 RepID=UPI003F70FD1E